jgi:sugar (pentulose or hexulose) kinase
MEGTAMETLAIEEAAEGLTGATVTEAVTVGGGARNLEWLHIKSDVTGRRHVVPDDVQSVVRGAALAAAIGSGSVRLEDVSPLGSAESIEPDPDRNTRYRRQYVDTYLPFQGPLRVRRGNVAAGSLAHA